MVKNMQKEFEKLYMKFISRFVGLGIVDEI